MPGVWDGVWRMRIGRSSMWLTRFYPELSLLASDAECRDVASQAKRRLAVHWLRLCAAVIGVCLGIYSLSNLLNLARFPPLAVEVMLNLLGITAGMFFMHVLYIRPMRAQIRHVLNERGIPVCLRCGYSLADLPNPRCPECGQPFEAKGDAE